jgi:arylformamidase
MNAAPLDISRVISPRSTVYAGSKPLGLTPLCSMADGSKFNITKLDWTTHFLTHVDAPYHAIAGGASLDQVPLGRFMGDALVVEALGTAVEAEDLPALAKGMNILFKTRNSSVATDAPFDRNYVYISPRAAQMLGKTPVNLVGIDCLNVDRFGDDSFPAHQALLGNDVLILEGLDLSGVSPGRYRLMALPLRIERGDGSPVRAVLFPV